MTDEVVTRLYRALIEELQRRGHAEDRPLKVSELYQQLVPYRSVRSRLGVELNADYEHALLRLLSGERDLLRLEPAQAREELRREVEAPYPFVGLFRKFSASNVWVTMPEGVPSPSSESDAPAPAASVEPAPAPAADLDGAGSGARDAEPSAPVPHGTDAVAGDEAPQRMAARAAEPRPGKPGERVTLRSGGGPDPAPAVQLHPEAAEHEPSERLTHQAANCAFCTEDLPAGRRIRFCPHCGGDQRLRPCPRCDAVLERDWRYCISCGHEVAG